MNSKWYYNANEIENIAQGQKALVYCPEYCYSEYQVCDWVSGRGWCSDDIEVHTGEFQKYVVGFMLLDDDGTPQVKAV